MSRTQRNICSKKSQLPSFVRAVMQSRRNVGRAMMEHVDKREKLRRRAERKDT